MAYELVRTRCMNRLYITGDVEPIKQLLSDFRARYDSRGYWLPLHREAAVRAALKVEAEYQAQVEAARKSWEQAMAVVPSDYRTRHGAAFGGVIAINGEKIEEPALETSRLPWVELARYERRVRDLTGQSMIHGRVRDCDTLYAATVADGRQIYRVSHYCGFGDDLRETYFLPMDLWTRMMEAEVRMRGITREDAIEWLARCRGCVGTELYEFAASQSLSSAPAAPRLSA